MPRVGVVAHAGLGVRRSGRAPGRASLARVLALGVDAVEVDVCATADGAVVLHHDRCTPHGVPLSALTLTELRRANRSVLTIDQAMEQLSGRLRVVVDIKTPHAVAPLATWLQARADDSGIVVCADRVDALRFLQARAPRTATWRTFPELGVGARQYVLRVLAGIAAHRGRDAVHLAGDLAEVVGTLRHRPKEALSRLAGVPWRRLLPDLLGGVRHDLGASGIAVHHPLVTDELCTAAHALGLTVTAWTVNEPKVAKRVASSGVDLITTDRVKPIRRAIPARPYVLPRTAGRRRRTR